MIHPKLRRKQIVTLVIFSILLLAACTWVCLQENIKFQLIIFKTLIGQGEYYDQLILMEFRFPRMLITILAGAALSLSGAIIQSVTKNQLRSQVF